MESDGCGSYGRTLELDSPIEEPFVFWRGEFQDLEGEEVSEAVFYSVPLEFEEVAGGGEEGGDVGASWGNECTCSSKNGKQIAHKAEAQERNVYCLKSPYLKVASPHS